MKQWGWVAKVMLGAAVALPAAAERHAITTEQIADAVRHVGMEISPQQIAMMSDVVASSADPELRVQSIQPVAGDRAIVRLQCARVSQCLPFFVSLHLSGTSATQPAAAAVRSAAPPVLPVTTSSPAPVLVRRGSVATLDLDGEHVHISIPVISLENGSAGQSIRVTDRNHKQTYMAQVVDSGVVEARF
jgi:hypothetical protein